MPVVLVEHGLQPIGDRIVGMENVEHPLDLVRAGHNRFVVGAAHDDEHGQWGAEAEEIFHLGKIDFNLWVAGFLCKNSKKKILENSNFF